MIPGACICSNCIHWSSPEKHWANAGFGECSKIPHRETVGEWQEKEPFDWIVPEHIFAIAQDASGYSASLGTRPNFGCILWEKKNER
jgi:hypothetical protein